MCGGLLWLGCGSIQTHEPWERQGLSSRAAETGCGLTRSVLPSSSSQRLASRPDIPPAQRLECQPVSPTGSRVLAVLLTGLRWTADGAFCPVTPWGHTERVGGDRCVYVPLVAPPHTHTHILRPGQMPVTLILEKAETKGGKGTQLEKENAMCRYQIWSQKSAQ